MHKEYDLTLSLAHWQFISAFFFIISLNMLQFYSRNNIVRTTYFCLSILAILCYVVVMYAYDFRDWRILKDTFSFSKIREFGYLRMFLIYILSSLIITFIGDFLSINNEDLASHYGVSNAFRSTFIQTIFFSIVVIFPVIQKIIESNIKQFKYFQIELPINYKSTSYLTDILFYTTFGIFAFNYSSYFYLNLIKFDLSIQLIGSFGTLAIYILTVPIIIYLKSSTSFRIIPNFDSKSAKILYITIFILFIIFSLYSFLLNIYLSILIFSAIIGNHFIILIVTRNKNVLVDDQALTDGILIASIFY